MEKRWFYKSKCYQDSFRSLQVTNAYDGRQEGAAKDPWTLGWTPRRRNGLESWNLPVLQWHDGFVYWVDLCNGFLV